MAGKKVWLTWMPVGEAQPGPDGIASELRRCGMQMGGAKWEDNLEKVVWSELAQVLADEDKADIWMIAANRSDLESSRNRYALSMVMATVQSERTVPLRVFVLGLDFKPEQSEFPALLRSATPLNGQDKGWPAKVVAGSFVKKDGPDESFRFSVIGHALIGQWYEIGPREGEWDGVMLGVSGEGSIVQHAVGPKGQLPERTVLEYPIQGIQAKLGETDFVACSVRNHLSPDESYYVKVEGWPSKVIIGGEPESEEAEVFVLNLS